MGVVLGRHLLHLDHLAQLDGLLERLTERIDQLLFPPPQRHDDGYGKWAGYDYPVSLPVTFTLAAPRARSS